MKDEKELVRDFEKIDHFENSKNGISNFLIYRNDFRDHSQILGEKGFEFVSTYYNRSNTKHILVSTREVKDIDRLRGANYQLLVSVEPVNNLISINEFFEAVHHKLQQNALFIFRFKPQEHIERKILTSHSFPLNKIKYLHHFIYRRVFPKLSLTRSLYFFLTKGMNRSIRQLEMIGRLYAGGYELVNEYFANGYLYLVAKKKSSPRYHKFASYGLLFKMRRIGKGGKEILVYKIRTMVPFSEYLQEEFLKKNRLAKGGKICNDIRITPIGKILRKFWIDELPNFVNLIKGEMKLVGVRPISKQYLLLYDEELQDLRKRVTPGIVPPFYADLPETLEEIQASEKRYIKSYLKSPLKTDVRYLFLSIKNIVTKRLTSH
ncbi:sugar transferase [Marinifilum caeruleilacunae]|uniref:Sugar transferase n=1 Tax=Marinifilum caeruleilacunae TaxID=2499076 RepID=A0ABX1WQN8_9BACT|nr:sugar transferase [Marinifilum caeruleilacunae]NOU58407.1 sugar transferase [Marinifilum caeruleilacunae]